MSALGFGCALIAFGLPISLFLFILIHRAHLAIVALLSAFSYLISLFIASTWFMMIPPLKETYIWITIWGVIFQEFTRITFYKLYINIENKLIQLTNSSKDQLPFSDFSSALAAGIGYGTMHSVMMYGSILSASAGTGTYYSDSCKNIPLVFTTAWLSLAFFILDIIWTLLLFLAFQKQKKGLLYFIIISHLMVSFFSLFNELDDGCVISLPLIYTILFFSIFLGWKYIPHFFISNNRSNPKWQEMERW